MMTNIDSDNNSVQHGSWTKLEQNEGKRMVQMGCDAGIPKQFIEEHISPEELAGRLSMGAETPQCVNFIFNAAKNWGLNGHFIVVEGGTQQTREEIGRICLYRAIVANSLEPNRIALSFSMSEVNGILVSAPVFRTQSTELIKSIPVLLLSELDTRGEFSKFPEAKAILDGLLNGRETLCHPTIITVEGEISKSPEIRERYGSKMARILSGNDTNTSVLKARS
jgi:hypothetical protein